MNAAHDAADVTGTLDPLRLIESLRLERTLVESALQVSQERFRELAENINEVFWTSDAAGDLILYVSPAYEKIWGRTCDSLYDSRHSWMEAVHPDDRKRVQESLALRAAGGYDTEYRILRPDGTIRWIHDKAFPIRNAEGVVHRYVGLADDITDRKKLEERIMHAQKMDAIGTLSGGIAHDFNNILAVINGYAELLRMSVPAESPIAEHVEAIAVAGSRATKLVRQILTFSRREEFHRETISLRPVVEEALKFLRATIPATITFKKSLEEHSTCVLADATQIHQVIVNLGANAWHAMKDCHGILDVALQEVIVDADMATLQPQLQQGRYVRVSVKDNGKGMDPATLARIFEPYFTTKPPGEGTGLGLSVVHGIMQGHGGAIDVFSKQGEGTTFHLYFPAVASSPLESTADPGPHLRGNAERILFVDDEESITRVGRQMLTRMGYAVEAVTSPSVALDLVREQPERFDLVITDLAMPTLTGLELARKIASARPHLPIILTTGNPGSLTLAEVRGKGVCELLVKPPTSQSLFEAINRALSAAKLEPA
jgi:PAS domain S-box-containing protein